MRRRFQPGADLPLEARQLQTADLAPGAAITATPPDLAATTAPVAVAVATEAPGAPPGVEIDPAAGPSVVQTRLQPAGRLQAAIVLEFDRPMDRASVESPAAYRVLQVTPPSTARKALGAVFLGLGSGETPPRPVRVLSAHYDADRNAVTLIVPRPQDGSARLQVRNAVSRPRPRHNDPAVPQVRDLTGRPLHHGTPFAGRFIVNVGGLPAARVARA